MEVQLEGYCRDTGSGPAISSELKLFRSTGGDHAFVVDGSRIYDLDPDTADRVGTALGLGDSSAAEALDEIWRALGVFRPLEHRYVRPEPVALPGVNALSLNVAQACNMGCRYCYADQGRFQGPARRMHKEVALASIDRLFEDSDADARLVLGFMGGEPLLARSVVHRAARYAWTRADELGRDIGFSITTNATLVREEDAQLFCELPFAVTVSADGTRREHQELRPMNNRGDSYDALLEGLEVIDRVGRPVQLSARATVTNRTGRLLPLLDHLLDLGFDDVGFSAVVVSPDPGLEVARDDFQNFLDHMIECGEKAVREIKADRPYPFSNLETALQEIHRGTHRPLPCGAGAGYLSVDASGNLFACHRLIGDREFALGDVFTGSNKGRRRRLLGSRHVDSMAPCRNCWARYLCGGGCYHEVKARGRTACDYIRGWLEFCLEAYVELSGLHNTVQRARETGTGIQGASS